MSQIDRWKNLERDCADHFDLLLKKIAAENKIPYKHLLSKDDKLIERNKRGDDFGRTDSDVDVIQPTMHRLIGGPFIVESKYRKSNVLAKLFNDFAKTRPSSFLTPMMILSSNGKHYLARWLDDFNHKNWMRDREWGDIWITSKKLSKSNKYLQENFGQARDYFAAKAKQYNIDISELQPLVVTRGFRSKAVIIQEMEPSNEFGDK